MVPAPEQSNGEGASFPMPPTKASAKSPDGVQFTLIDTAPLQIVASASRANLSTQTAPSTPSDTEGIATLAPQSLPVTESDTRASTKAPLAVESTNKHIQLSSIEEAVPASAMLPTEPVLDTAAPKNRAAVSLSLSDLHTVAEDVIDLGTPAPRDEVKAMIPEVLVESNTSGVEVVEDMMEDFFDNETLSPEIFSRNTFAPDYFDNFTLPPELMDEQADDLPWFLQGGTVAPKIAEGGSLPPFLMNGGSLAPGLIKGGDIDINFIHDSWTEDLIPDLDGLELNSSEQALPVFQPMPFFIYKPSFTIKVSGIARFGMSRDFASLGYLINDGEPTQDSPGGEDYLVGLSVMAGVIVAFFFIWWLFLRLVCMCCSRIVLTRSPFPATEKPNVDDTTERKGDSKEKKPPEPQEEAPDIKKEHSAELSVGDESANSVEEEVSCSRRCYCRNSSFLNKASFSNTVEREAKAKESKAAIDTIKRCAARTRIAFVVAAFVQITFAALLVVKGAPNLYKTIHSMENFASTARETVNDGNGVLGTVKEVLDLSKDLRDQLSNEFDNENPCPGYTNFAESDTGKKITDTVNSTVEWLAEISMDLNDGVESLGEGLLDGESYIDSVDELIEVSTKYEVVGYLFALPFMILVPIMLFGIIAAQLHAKLLCFSKVISWLILPLFVLVTALSICFCIVLTLTAAMNADFCGAGESNPEQTILDLMINTGTFKATDGVYTTAEYFLYQCTSCASEDPLLEFRQMDNDIIKAKEVINKFTNSMSDVSIESITFGCQTDFWPLFEALREMKALASLGRQCIASGMAVVDCKKVSSMLQILLYEGTCTYSVEGLAWCAGCLFVVSLMGMIMITLRSALQNNLLLEDEESEGTGDSDSKLATSMESEDIPSDSAFDDDNSGGVIRVTTDVNGENIPSDGEVGAATPVAATFYTSEHSESMDSEKQIYDC